MRILAIDASTKSSGWAIFNDTKLEDYGCITAASADMIGRIQKIIKDLRQVLLTYPDTSTIVLEEVRPELGPQTNQKTHKALMYLQAAIAFLIHDEFSSIRIEYIYPNSWRKECGIKIGKGHRSDELKQADIAFVKQTYNIEVNDDIADAIGIGYARSQKLNNEINWE